MTTKRKTPARKEYSVWADRRVFQHVEAASPEEAYRIAQQHPDDFEPCTYGIENFELIPFVGDVETGEEFRVGSPATNCRTCGSEIVETINDSRFRDGECGPCEYERYRSQPELLRACEYAVEHLAATNRNHLWIRDVIRKAHGHAA